MFEFLHHLFLPHHTNNYRAKVLHHDFFVFYMLFCFLSSIFLNFGHRVSPDLLGFATDIHVDKLVEYTNKKRIEAGVAPVILNPLLSQAAAGKAQDMFGNDYWAHNSPQGKTPWDFINGSGYVYTVAGENLAKNFNDSQEVIEAWMNSPSHKENLLRGQYEDIGFAVVNGRLNGEETTLVVQMFGKQLVKAPNSQNITQAASIIPPVDQAQAEESIVEKTETREGKIVTEFAETESVPSSIAAMVKPVETPPQSWFSVAGAVVKKPIIDIKALSKNFMLTISIILAIALFLDGYYIWRHKIVRVGGKSSAHLFFLFGLTGLFWVLQLGSIL